MNDLAQRIRNGDLRALARGATLVENGDPEAAPMLRDLAADSRQGFVIGITGAPGAGKSSLIDHLCRIYRQQGKTIAVVAVDPSSEATGGAILGDRIRMQGRAGDSGVFIRSMATRGVHGGLAATTAGLVALFRASGRDIVIVETVGVGQAEIDIARLADVTVVVLVPGMGDDVQAIKAGILEIAGVFAINKSDRPGVEALEQELHAELGHTGTTRIVRTIATDGTGIDQLVEAIEERRVAGTSASAPEESHAITIGGVVLRLSRTGSRPFRVRRVSIRVPDLLTAQARLSDAGVAPAEYDGRLVLEPSAGGVRIELIEDSEETF